MAMLVGTGLGDARLEHDLLDRAEVDTGVRLRMGRERKSVPLWQRRDGVSQDQDFHEGELAMISRS